MEEQLRILVVYLGLSVKEGAAEILGGLDGQSERSNTHGTRAAVYCFEEI